MKALILRYGWIFFSIGCFLSLIGCTHPYLSQYYGEHVKRGTLALADTTSTAVAFEDIREKWMVRLSIPDPLGPNTVTDKEQPEDARRGMIRIWATLYDQEIIDAWVRQSSEKDSLSFDEASQRYAVQHHPEDQFRIELKMESGFVPESLEPRLWTLYLVDEADIMYEPISIQEEPVLTKERRIYSVYPVSYTHLTLPTN